MHHTFRVATVALFTAVTLAISARAADAAFSYNVVSDDSSRDTTYLTPTVHTVTTSLGQLYTAGGTPTVIQAGNITFNFNLGLSSNFASQADGVQVLDQSTDGRLVLTIHFDTPTSIAASLTEGGNYATTGDGKVSVTGGEFVMEAVNTPYTESHASSLTTSLLDHNLWTATASIAPFSGYYTDYRLVVDNDLEANATNGAASISKTGFSIVIIPGSGDPPVPEPASLSLLGIGSAALLLRRRRA